MNCCHNNHTIIKTYSNSIDIKCNVCSTVTNNPIFLLNQVCIDFQFGQCFQGNDCEFFHITDRSKKRFSRHRMPFKERSKDVEIVKNTTDENGHSIAPSLIIPALEKAREKYIMATTPPPPLLSKWEVRVYKDGILYYRHNPYPDM